MSTARSSSRYRTDHWREQLAAHAVGSKRGPLRRPAPANRVAAGMAQRQRERQLSPAETPVGGHQDLPLAATKRTAVVITERERNRRPAVRGRVGRLTRRRQVADPPGSGRSCRAARSISRALFRDRLSSRACWKRKSPHRPSVRISVSADRMKSGRNDASAGYLASADNTTFAHNTVSRATPASGWSRPRRASRSAVTMRRAPIRFSASTASGRSCEAGWRSAFTRVAARGHDRAAGRPAFPASRLQWTPSPVPRPIAPVPVSPLAARSVSPPVRRRPASSGRLPPRQRARGPGRSRWMVR